MAGVCSCSLVASIVLTVASYAAGGGFTRLATRPATAVARLREVKVGLGVTLN